MEISKIYEGWKNNLLPPEELKEVIKTIQSFRLEICKVCPEHSSNKENYNSIRWDDHCVNCGCTLSAKTACLTCECPLKKWKAVLTEDQQKEITK